MAKDDKWEMTGELTEDGQFLCLDHYKMISRLIKPLIGEKLLITFIKYRAKRSDAQNRYIHGVVVPVVRAWLKETEGKDYTHDEVYTYLRLNVLKQKVRVTTILGEEVITMEGKRFSAMNTKEFADAINEIVVEMDSRECYIPLPKDDNLIHQIVQGNNLDDK